MRKHIGIALVVLSTALHACSDAGSSGGDGSLADMVVADVAVADAVIQDSLASPDTFAPVTCPPGDRDGPPGSTDGLKSNAGTGYVVRTPDTYNSQTGQPLIVVFSPAGGTALKTEQTTGLTVDAKTAGHVIAYVDHVSPVSTAAVEDIASIPELIAERWCIDTSRIYLTGSSDGASVIYVMLLNDQVPLLPAAIAPFAAGVSAKTLVGVPCMKDPLPVMVLHNAGDTVFPGYGREAADWWIGCDGCSATGGATLPDGCIPYGGCASGVEVQYCEGAGGHGSWPDINGSMIAFFERFRRAL